MEQLRSNNEQMDPYFSSTSQRQAQRYFGNLVEKYQPELIRYACTFVDKQDAEELVSDVFMNLWRRRDDVHIYYSLQSYLYRAVRNACYNKRSSKGNAICYVSLPQDDIRCEDMLNPEERLYCEDTRIKVKRTINALPPQCRKVFNLNRNEGLTYEEISQRLNISVNTVNTQLYRARKRIAELLKAS